MEAGGTMGFIGKVSDVAAGQLVRIDVDGTPVTVANVDGRLFAIGDQCTHRGCSLSEGELSGNVITCACHGGQFDVTTGEVVDGPPREPTPTYAVQVTGDEFRVG
jgi:nitrite reductase/ring-hydroxylating ferredoxin subunit